MPSDLENLMTRKSAILAELAEWETGKPTYGKAGQRVEWTEYRRSLWEEVQKLDQLIAAAQGPFELRTEGRST